MKLDTAHLKKMLKMISSTRDDEIGCSECDKQIEKFAEMQLKGKSPASAMPLVQAHLKRCRDCREEYEALLEALKELHNPANSG